MGPETGRNNPRLLGLFLRLQAVEGEVESEKLDKMKQERARRDAADRKKATTTGRTRKAK